MTPLQVTTNEDQSQRDHRFRQLYHKPPDFQELARLDPAFATATNGRELDFQDPKAVVQLTKTLLKLDFGLEIELPDDRLCPPVTSRHNYILWIKDLLDSTSYDASGGKAVGLDIGTGASCIYPLLGCVQRPWSFLATDIDTKSIELAKRNVRKNDFSSRIAILHRSPEDTLIPSDQILPIDFAMTNPPFYASRDDLIASAKAKARPPFTACTGSETEMIYPGGEVAFVDRILQESIALPNGKVRWFTAMLGFLGSVTAVVEKLREKRVDNYAVTELVQGAKTRRWVVGWSFLEMRPDGKTARGTHSIPKHLLPPITEVEVTKTCTKDVGKLVDHLVEAVGKLELISWEWNRERLEGVGRAVDKVWARAWRRKRKRDAGQISGQNDEQKTERMEVTSGQSCKFGFKLVVRVTVAEAVVVTRWTEGHDESSFESFQGFVKATVQSLRKD